MRRLAALVLLWVLPPCAWGLSPMQSYQDLVAGEGTSGFEDGPFYSALFNSPQGLAFSPDGTKLYVADTGNHCIRVVDLEEANQVSTLTGNGKPGLKDGLLSEALFNQPTALVFISDKQIAVNDDGNALIRLIDLDKKTVTTLAGNNGHGTTDGEALKAQVGPIWSMVYLPSRNGLYFTQPVDGLLRKLDLKTGKVLTVFHSKPEIPHPAAMAVTQGKLYIADAGNGQVFELSPRDNSAPEDGASFQWTTFAKGSNITSMEWSAGTLYALQRDDQVPWAQLTPSYKPITFVSIWGDTITQNPAFYYFFDGGEGPPAIQIAADPRSQRKLYFPNPGLNLILSHRDLWLQDYKFAELPNGDGLTDFLYPEAKPPRTFRILIIGDSHTFHFYAGEVKKRGWEFYNRFATMSKKAEEILNMRAAIEDVPLHFEILHYGQVSGNHLCIWPYHVVPGLVKKYDIDLVLFLLTPNLDLEPFYQFPLDTDGVPKEPDTEYMLKPYQQRIQPGLPKEFFELCQKKKMVSINLKQIQFAPAEQLYSDPEVSAKMAELYTRPTKLLREKLDSMNTQDGKPVRLEMALLPSGSFSPLLSEGEASAGKGGAYWKQALEDIGAPTLDLESPMTALRISYFPLSELEGYDHFSADGQLLMGSLLAEELIREKLIPFEPVQK